MVQRSPEQKPVRLSAVNTIFSSKKVFDAAKSQKQPPQVFRKRKPATLLERGSSTAKFLRTPILKNICESLLLKINISVTNSEAVVQRCSVKKLFLEISHNSQENTCARVFFNKVAALRPVQVFSCGFFEISKNTLTHRTPLVAASANLPKGGNFW